MKQQVFCAILGFVLLEVLLSDGSLSHPLCHMKQRSPPPNLSSIPHLPSVFLFLYLSGSLGKVVGSRFDRGKITKCCINKKMKQRAMELLGIPTMGRYLAIFFSCQTQWLGAGPFFFFFFNHLNVLISLASTPSTPFPLISLLLSYKHQSHLYFEFQIKLLSNQTLKGNGFIFLSFTGPQSGLQTISMSHVRDWSCLRSLG